MLSDRFFSKWLFSFLIDINALGYLDLLLLYLTIPLNRVPQIPRKLPVRKGSVLHISSAPNPSLKRSRARASNGGCGSATVRGEVEDLGMGRVVDEKIFLEALRRVANQVGFDYRCRVTYGRVGGWSMSCVVLCSEV
ncbi:hypothetical protein GQ43DRAFT_443379 [Delitschia confertaspora ATCC 74209]|uniref:Uncharacterized protein n=1 Tax=Delitschia confertaspora ATCC 74209 TaxID=1513339 RepID=A0A9P4JFW4_9PLEO|nr:hypothetical protein GQ43DRAFT_443379 [Delitschia confertaspora ATCC 74209]